MTLYSYLKANYKEGTPIFTSEFAFDNISGTNVRQQLKKLTDSGKLKRFASGVYYLPKPSVLFKSGSTLSINEVLKQKYLRNDGKLCGYATGLGFANAMGVTTQVPAVVEFCTNKASTAFRRVVFARRKIILRKPRTIVTADNFRQLQLLDFFCEVDIYAEFSDDEVSKRISDYMKRAGIDFSSLSAYFSLYPDKLFRNFYRYGVLNNVFA